MVSPRLLDPLLVVALEVARQFRLPAQLLDGIDQILHLAQDGITQVLGPVQIVAHEGEHAGELDQDLDTFVPGLAPDRLVQVFALQVRVFL
jgi:hypothetical protein